MYHKILNRNFQFVLAATLLVTISMCGRARSACFYATLVDEPSVEQPMTHSTQSQERPSIRLQPTEEKYEDLPVALTSFGAASLGGKLYVVGGKSGRAHHYASSFQNRNVFCLDPSAQPQWKSVSESDGLQGLAIVASQDSLYRIGGLEARNQEGEDHDLHSSNSFVRLDLKSGRWEAMPDLPRPCSSLDACLAGRKIFVVGGWDLQGEQDPNWAETMMCFDLDQPKAGWRELAVPFRTRALAVEVWRDQLVVVGGIESSGETTNSVHLYDLKANRWSVGPNLPLEDSMRGFGCAALGLEDHLLVSTYGGQVFGLRDDASGWDLVHKLETGRFFHQMLPLGKDRIAIVGGANMESGGIAELEVLRIVPSSTE